MHAGRWVEYGLVEAAYAAANPTDFRRLVERYGHTAIQPTQYTASAFIAATLGRLRQGPATGRWRYNSQISWWAVAPEPAWDITTSWAEVAQSMDYVPGSTE